jgi:hypothetical protein
LENTIWNKGPKTEKTKDMHRIKCQPDCNNLSNSFRVFHLPDGHRVDHGEKADEQEPAANLWQDVVVDRQAENGHVDENVHDAPEPDGTFQTKTTTAILQWAAVTHFVFLSV